MEKLGRFSLSKKKKKTKRFNTKVLRKEKLRGTEVSFNTEQGCGHAGAANAAVAEGGQLSIAHVGQGAAQAPLWLWHGLAVLQKNALLASCTGLSTVVTQWKLIV